MQKTYGTAWMNELYTEWQNENDRTILEVDNWDDFTKNSLKYYVDEDLCDMHIKIFIR